MGYIATVVPAAKLTKGNFNYVLHKGDVIDKIVFSFAHGKAEFYGVQILDFVLKISAANKNRVGSVYDSLATHYPAIDNVGNFRDSAKWYDVKSILFKMPLNPDSEIFTVDIDKIDYIAGTFENEDGTRTIGVDITDETTSLQETISGANDNDTIVISEGEVSEEITVDQAVTLAGINAGVPQNHEQEVA